MKTRLAVILNGRTWHVGTLIDEDASPEDESVINSPHFDKSFRLLEKPQELIFRLNKNYMDRGFKVNKIGKDGYYLVIYHDPNEDKKYDYTQWAGWRAKMVFVDSNTKLVSNTTNHLNDSHRVGV